MALSLDAFDQHVFRFVEQRRLRLRRLPAWEVDSFVAATHALFDQNGALRHIYGLDARDVDVHVLEDVAVRRHLAADETWLLEHADSGRLGALLTTAAFAGAGLAHGDANLLEIGLVASSVSGAGRALLALALRRAALDAACEGVVLELLAGADNRAGAALYQSFGFAFEECVRADGEPLLDQHGEVMRFLTNRDSFRQYADSDMLKETLRLQWPATIVSLEEGEAP